MQKLLLTTLLFFTISSSFCQRFYSVVFNELPADMQLYPRNAQNQAIIPINGRIEVANWLYLSVVVLRNKQPYAYQRASISYNAKGDTGTFVLNPVIKAELAEYDIQVYASQAGKDSVLIVNRENIVAGDAYIIFGQSNARGWEEIDPYQNEYCRTFGFGYLGNDFTWGLSNSDHTGYYYDRQIVGAWGIGFQKYIMETYGIPTCIISQATPGQPISALAARNPNNHADPETQYGRLLTYVTQAKLSKAIKALFYWQGETEAAHIPSEWKPTFDVLYRELEEDYPSIQRYYVFQLPLFGGNFYNEEVGVMRDYQRRLSSIYPKITSFGALGASGWDGFHYKTTGYRQLGTELAKIVSHDFYGETKKYLSPNIQKAYFSTPARDEIVLSFEEGQQMVYPKDTTIYNFIVGGKGTLSVKDFFYLNGRWQRVAEGRAEENKIVLKLKQPASLQDTLVKYLPSVFPYSGGYDHLDDLPWVYLGPFLKNTDGFRAMAFHNVKLAQALQMPVISVNNITYEQIQINWQAVPQANKYLIERKKQGENSFVKVAETSNITYTDTRLLSNQAYVYRLKAFSSTSESSAQIEAKTQAVLATEEELRVAVNIYPNPAQNEVNIELPKVFTGNLSITDITGLSCFARKINKESLIRLDISALPTGTYLVVINNENESYTQKLSVIGR